jgi:thiopeptide-type bacteriocin biosynthesis protein
MTPAGFFAFRAAALPLCTLTEWAEGAEAPTASPADVDGAVDRDRARLRDRLAAVARRREVRAALWIASPDLLDAVDTRPADPGVEAALVRYVTRMASRATPFGLFAACGRGDIGDRTDVRLPDPSTWGRFTQLDADYLDALVRERAAALADRVTLRPNDSLHLMAGRWRYVESRLDGLERTHHLVQVAGSSHLQRAIDAAGGGATRGQVIDAVAAAGVDAARAAGYVDRLVTAQVLVSTLAVAITGPPPLVALIADLRGVGDEATAGVLQAVHDDLAAIDREGPGAPPERYDAAVESLRTLPAPIDRARLLHVDATVPACDATLARVAVDDIQRGVDVLRRIAPPRPPTDLDRFRDAFLERYESEEVALLDALDEELGVGFGGDLDRRDPAPLLEGLGAPDSSTRTTSFGRRERRLLELLHRAWTDGAHEITLTKDDVVALENDDALPLPSALSASAVLARTAHGVRAVLTGAGGPSGARLLGRFCHADPQLDGDVRTHLRAEEALDPEAVYAEIVHLPSGRMVNVLARPALRDHEIAWLGRPGVPSESVLDAGDLLVSVRDGHFVLRSRRLGRRVVPRLTSAHNYDRHSPGVYRFLAAIQADGVAETIPWTWFPFDRAPFTPRVRFGSLVLERARWTATTEELRKLDGWNAVQDWRHRRRLPRWICLVEGDNVLACDLDNVVTVDTLVRTVRRRDEALFEELFPGPDELPAGGHVLEVVVPLVAGAPAAATAPAALVNAPPVRRVFPPGSEWTYVQLYAGSATADRLLTEAVGPLARRLVGSGAADSWFFMRYADPQFHVRVRFHGDPDGIRPAVDELVAGLVDDGLVHDAKLATYRREVERYGGPERILVAERVFHADSDAVVELLDLFQPGEAGLDARWRIGLLGTDRLMADLGLDAPTRAALSRRMRDAFDREFRADATLRKGVAARVRAEVPSLDELLDAQADSDHPFAPGIRVLDERSARISALGGGPLADLAVPLVHMWLNRLHRSENRFHEYVTYALLARLHDARARRPR